MSTPTQIELDGRTYNGSYTVDDHVVTVHYLTHVMSQRIEGQTPGLVARDLLAKLVHIAQKKQA